MPISSISASHLRAASGVRLLSGNSGWRAAAAIRDRPSSMNDQPDLVEMPNSNANGKS